MGKLTFGFHCSMAAVCPKRSFTCGRDRYGRIIGKLIKDGQDINLLQIKHGYAWHYKYYQKDQSELDRILYGSAEIEAGLIDCIVSLLAKLFLNTQIPAFHQFDI